MNNWVVAVFAWPLIGALLAVIIPARGALLATVAGVGVSGAVAGLTWQVATVGPQQHHIGGWGSPLGIDVYADGLTSAMLAMTALVGIGITRYAASYFHGVEESKQARWFWPIWLLLWTALNGLFVAADLFNVYVTLELIGLAAVILAALGKEAAASAAAMRYLLVSMLGSLSYLLGVALLYATFGSLAFAAASTAMQSAPSVSVALVLVTSGLLLKAAVFPLHFWLPPAHANAPAPVSAALSALVVKAAVYLLWRLWFDVFGDTVTPAASQVLGVLGGAAVLWGSWHALTAERLKLLAAYSTVAQLGYFCLVFPLALTPGAGFAAWAAVIYLALSHAFAKAALFLAAGNVLKTLGHDRIRELQGTSERLPITTFALALAGIALVGLPPSGGFIGKWILLNVALTSAQWVWVVVLVVGTLLAGGYVFRVLLYAFGRSTDQEGTAALMPNMEWTALALALLATLGLGFAATPVIALLGLSAPFSGPVLLPVLP